ncbi:MAG: DUF4198 domain-containing protein [Gemmataceae bacterium]
MLRCILVVVGFALTSPAFAHFPMLLPVAASGQTEKPVTIVYQWGHPFEHQLFDAPKPEGVGVMTPDGSETAIEGVQKTEVPGEVGKKVSAYRFSFTPKMRGDHTFFLIAPPIWLEEEKLFLHDTVKVVYHVQTQNAWDLATPLPFELVPLTRPYGLQPGMVFQATVLRDRALLGGVRVEVERYNPTPPKELPADEQITRLVKTDPNGVLTCTLTDSGWWCMTAAINGEPRERDGKKYPVKRRATLWVFVDEKPAK